MNNICDIIIHGGHGDLSFRKLLPSLYHLFNDKYIDKNSRVIVVSRVKMTLKENQELIKTKLIEFLEENEYDDKIFENFKELLYIVKVDFTDESSYKNLEVLLNEKTDIHRINYLSTSPDFFGAICASLNSWKLIHENTSVVLEKPIGRDLKSSRNINQEVLKYFKEDKIYRIDHYLGKDAVQNIMALRFSNRFFMPLWDAANIDHVQISLSEDVGVEGRSGYYDDYGAMRDMIQNHLIQLLCLVAMEPPSYLNANSIRDEKVKVLRAFRNMSDDEVQKNTVRAQYTQGIINDSIVPGYKEAKEVENSETETFVALKVNIDNFRWKGVPFYIRSGKRMEKRNAEIVIVFKEVPHSIFVNGGSCLEQNKLIITLQPNESIKLKLMNKIPGLDNNIRLKGMNLELNDEQSDKRKNESYERLILDVIRENSTLFMRLDEVEAAWKWTDIIIDSWKKDEQEMHTYNAGTNGPIASIQLIENDGRKWNEE